MTLLGQGGSYWSGDYEQVHEFNPLAKVLLQHHPLLFVLAAAVSCLLVVFVLLNVNSGIALVGSFVVTFCHTVAAAGWLLRFGVVGVVAAVLLLVMVERLFWLASRKASPTTPIGI